MSVFRPGTLDRDHGSEIQPPQPQPTMNRYLTFPEETLLTANVSRGAKIKPLGVVFHHTCGTWEGDRAWILNASNPAKGIYASYHAVIRDTGERRKFADDTSRCWHAGRSSWRGKNSCNDFMLGVAFSGDTYPGRRFGRSLTDAEIASALDWLAPRITRWGITMDWITDHRQVSPGRKDDINPVEWERLRRAIQSRFFP